MDIQYGIITSDTTFRSMILLAGMLVEVVRDGDKVGIADIYRRAEPTYTWGRWFDMYTHYRQLPFSALNGWMVVTGTQHWADDVRLFDTEGAARVALVYDYNRLRSIVKKNRTQHLIFPRSILYHRGDLVHAYTAENYGTVFG